MVNDERNREPLEGVTLKRILEELVERMGWEEMARAVPLRCFTHDPSIASSLKFLRKTPWARDKVEALYLLRKIRAGADAPITDVKKTD